MWIQAYESTFAMAAGAFKPTGRILG